ncbi:hypothetical protein [Nannocystis pusilla]|uniref:hypothetical protein n=1 Tax=Nannocystis pusilla TaxID=889268 RepID=UPI003DA210AF
MAPTNWIELPVLSSLSVRAAAAGASVFVSVFVSVFLTSSTCALGLPSISDEQAPPSDAASVSDSSE